LVRRFAAEPQGTEEARRTRRTVDGRRHLTMSVLDWFLTVVLVVIYVSLIVTVAIITFQKGYLLLGLFGIFIPILWLIGAILPAKPGSAYAIEREREMVTQSSGSAFRRF
jgi:hypothetical protein